jgi:N-acetylneuraminic acid mutarotase
MNKIIVIFFILTSISFTQNYGAWTQTDSLHEPRYQGASVELANGNILVAGGSDSLFIRSAEIFDYLTEKWTLINPMVKGRAYFKLVRLNNGNVLAVGGEYQTKSCEIYDTTAKKWSLTDSLNYQRSSDETVTILDDGNILVTGGYYLSVGKFGPLSSCEIYNPATAKWTITDSLKIVRTQHTATKLLDGRVLVAGGLSGTGELIDCEIYDPGTSKWSEAASLNTARYAHTAILLPDGKVLVSGGENYSYPTDPWLNSCELYDPIQNTWINVGSLYIPHYIHSEIILKNGLLLIAGGAINNDTWELYDLNNFSDIYLGIYPARQGIPLINLLPNGKILSAGGMTYIDTSGLLIVRQTSMCFLYDPNGFNGISKDKNIIIKGFELSQNYPNPFNPITTIKYDLPASSHILIKVYNSLGKEIATLTNNIQSQGSHSVNFSAEGLPTGVYFYKIISGTWTQPSLPILVRQKILDRIT